MKPAVVIFFLLLLFGLELIYFILAKRFNIIDRPNSRSSHSEVTIRGGGIIFPLSILLFAFAYNWDAVHFVIGLLAISIISFIDDIVTLKSFARLSVHFFAVSMLLFAWDIFIIDWYWVAIAVIFIIATINAYNFMDGINGITGAYSLITVATLYYLNKSILFTSDDFLITTGLGLVAFLFFNFRTRARCFAGDVGSVGIAFILVYALGLLILKTQNFAYLTLLLVYGMDTVTTIIFRLIRGENITIAHRSHFYQFLVNQKRWTHLQVASLYFVMQGAVSMIMILALKANFWHCFLLAIFLTLIFVAIRFSMEGKRTLLNPNKS